MNGYIGLGVLQGTAQGMSEYEKLLMQRHRNAQAQAAAMSDPMPAYAQQSQPSVPVQGSAFLPSGTRTPRYIYQPRPQEGTPIRRPVYGETPTAQPNLRMPGAGNSMTDYLATQRAKEGQMAQDYQTMLAQQAATRMASPGMTTTDLQRLAEKKEAERKQMEALATTGWQNRIDRTVSNMYAQGYGTPGIGFEPSQQGYSDLNTYYNRLKSESQAAAKAAGDAESRAWEQMNSYASSQIGFFDSEYKDALDAINAMFSQNNRYGSEEHQSALAQLASEHNTRVRNFLSQTYGKYVR